MIELSDFLSETILNYLIENDIELIGLGHLQLSDDWLRRTYNRNNSCIEALQTIELRKKQKEN